MEKFIENNNEPLYKKTKISSDIKLKKDKSNKNIKLSSSSTNSSSIITASSPVTTTTSSLATTTTTTTSVTTTASTISDTIMNTTNNNENENRNGQQAHTMYQSIINSSRVPKTAFVLFLEHMKNNYYHRNPNATFHDFQVEILSIWKSLSLTDKTVWLQHEVESRREFFQYLQNIVGPVNNSSPIPNGQISTTPDSVAQVNNDEKKSVYSKLAFPTFVQAMRDQVLLENPHYSYNEIQKELSKVWKNMSREEKQLWAKAELDNSYQSTTKKNVTSKKSSSYPVPPKSAYNLFYQCARKQLLLEFNGLSGKDIPGICSELWRNLPSSERALWQADAENDRLRYQRECIQLAEQENRSLSSSVTTANSISSNSPSNIQNLNQDDEKLNNEAINDNLSSPSSSSSAEENKQKVTTIRRKNVKSSKKNNNDRLKYDGKEQFRMKVKASKRTKNINPHSINDINNDTNNNNDNNNNNHLNDQVYINRNHDQDNANNNNNNSDNNGLYFNGDNHDTIPILSDEFSESATRLTSHDNLSSFLRSSLDQDDLPSSLPDLHNQESFFNDNLVYDSSFFLDNDLFQSDLDLFPPLETPSIGKSNDLKQIPLNDDLSLFGNDQNLNFIM